MKVDIKKLFWEVNVGWDMIPIFAELKKEYGKNNSSQIMWAFYFIYHPESEVYKAIDDLEERIETVKRSFLAKKVLPNFKDPLIKNSIKMFEKIGIPEHLKALLFTEQKIKEFGAMVKSMKITKTNAKDVVENLEAAKKLFAMHKENWDKFIVEEKKIKEIELRGGGTLSFMQNQKQYLTEKDYYDD